MTRLDIGLSFPNGRRMHRPGRAHAGAIVAAVGVVAARAVDPPARIQLDPVPAKVDGGVVTFSGSVSGGRGAPLLILVDGEPQQAPLDPQGRFSAQVALSPGANLVRVLAGGTVSRLLGGAAQAQVEAVVPRADIWTQLTWDGPGDLDLHLHLPDGEECFYSNQRTTGGASLDIDNQDGFGPEHIVVDHAAAGPYRLGVVYFAAKGGPARPIAWRVALRVAGRQAMVFRGVVDQPDPGKETPVTRFDWPRAAG